MKKLAPIIFVSLLLSMMPINIIALSSSPQTVPRIIILSDGSLDPAAVPIERNGEVYTFTDNICAQIVVDRNNIVIDGAGYILQGTYNGTRTDSWVVGLGPDQEYDETAIPWTIGIDLANEIRCGLTIKNLNIKNFYIGTYLWTTNNTITGCAISGNIVGILLSGDNNTIIGNYISHNDEGIFFGVNTEDVPVNIVLNHNSFVSNIEHFSGCVCEEYNTTEPMHTWDDGEEGNYWSDYNGTDADADGIGDTPYIIDALNRDRYPLTQLAAAPPTAPTKLPIEIIAAAVVLPVIFVVAFIAYKKKKQ
jgi:parallel beta-helix repeat protein